MSRSELERLVGEAEDRSALRQQLQRAREDHEASTAVETGWLLPQSPPSSQTFDWDESGIMG
jgi:hypothetical protein